jgi:hypothetical protein
MKYLCLISIDESKLAAMAPDEYQAVVERCLTYEEELRRRGRLLAAQALEPIRTASTVQVRDGRRSVMDGPFAETKEQIAGFFLIDAADRAEAIEIAAGMPQALIGSIEVRPLRPLQAHGAAEGSDT